MSAIGVDLDGVVYDCTGTLEQWLIMEGLYLPGQLPKPTAWRYFETDWGMTEEAYDGHFAASVNAGFMFRYGQPLPGAVASLDALKQAGHTVHLVTARHGDGPAKRSTVEWLEEWAIPWDGLTFSHDKAIARTDLFIDDKPSNVDHLRRAGTEAWLLNVYKENATHPYVVQDWTEFLEKVQAHQ